MFYCFGSMRGWGLNFMDLDLHLLKGVSDHKFFATTTLFSKKRRTLEQSELSC